MTPGNQQDIKFLTARECAAQIRVDKKTIYRWARADKFDYILVGRQIRVYRESWEKFLRSGKMPKGQS